MGGGTETGRPVPGEGGCRLTDIEVPGIARREGGRMSEGSVYQARAPDKGHRTLQLNISCCMDIAAGKPL